ncbi:Aste57867_11409 [Aphanomyces stellatus]|uniref:Aste57867_11409 protein n=1 Tax=Aphanomyces stellatus TaxID=120398 RepID=A0A485KUS3_9STRA|nr:hypothetical protein As57867_011367 [Aphanomyces stellatus]VFT88270.1 Aste57867_11409 [Aphanomyces stellatus]
MMPLAVPIEAGVFLAAIVFALLPPAVLGTEPPGVGEIGAPVFFALLSHRVFLAVAAAKPKATGVARAANDTTRPLSPMLNTELSRVRLIGAAGHAAQLAVSVLEARRRACRTWLWTK